MWMIFVTEYNKIIDQINSFDPYKYVYTRNYSDGSVSKLSPYVSRGVISTKIIYKKLIENKFNLKKCEKFIQELAWRDFWQQVWVNHGDKINDDFKHPQSEFEDYMICNSILDGKTGINAIDKEIKNLCDSGYMHNHMRMYVASIATNIAKSHWKQPAKWMYYHLLDGDWASNALSWQWVAGSNSNKKYYANQENINKYFYSTQKNSFLDCSYDHFQSMDIPKSLQNKINFNFELNLPNKNEVKLDLSLPTLLYNYYNLDPRWRANKKTNKLLVFEPELFKMYPVSKKCIDFCLELSKNIDDIQIYVGSFEDLHKNYPEMLFIFKEHPLNKHYKGEMDKRDWLYEIEGDFTSFFKYWNKIRKKLI